MRYYIERVAQAVVVLFTVVTLAFFLFRLMPLSPYEIILTRVQEQAAERGGQLSGAQLEAVRESVRAKTNVSPTAPLWKQYLQYVWAVFHLDFGQSSRFGGPVFEVLFWRMPWSIFISVYGLALGTTVSLILGAIMANREGSLFDKGLTVYTIVNNTIPYYVIAVVLLIIFAFNLGWFPRGGRYDSLTTTPGFNLPFMRSVVMHAALPIGSTFLAGFGGALAYRGNCIREKGKGYIRVARLRGINESRVALRYVGRNSLLPVYTGLLMSLSGIFGSSIILEELFNYQAVGYITFQALQYRDYNLMLGSLMFFAAITLLGILIADLTYGIIDPRVKGGADRESF